MCHAESDSTSYPVVTRNVEKVINGYYLESAVKEENLLVLKDLTNSKMLYFINYKTGNIVK